MMSIGSITTNANGTFRAFATVDGKRRTKSGFATRAAAEHWLALQRVSVGTATSCTFSDYWAARVEPTLGRLAPKTAHEYRRMWKITLEPIVGALDVSAMTHMDAQRVVDSIAAPSTQGHAAALLRKVVRMAVRDGYANADYTAALQLQRVRRADRRIMDISELPAWLDMVSGYRHELRMVLMLGCGLSVSEAYALDADADLASYEGDRIAVRVNKTLVDVNGAAVLNDRAKNEYRERIVIASEPFASRIGQLLPAPRVTSPSSATRSWHSWQLAHGWQPQPPSDLRPTFATWCGEAGVDTAIVDKAMGHAGTSTTARHYQRTTLRMMAALADALGEYAQQLHTETPFPQFSGLRSVDL